MLARTVVHTQNESTNAKNQNNTFYINIFTNKPTGFSTSPNRPIDKAPLYRAHRPLSRHFSPDHRLNHLTTSINFPKLSTTSYLTFCGAKRRFISSKNFRAHLILVFSMSRSSIVDMEPLVSATK